MTQRDIISLIENESELLAALGVWARHKTMEDRAAKIRRMTIAIGNVPLSVESGRERREEGRRRQFNVTV
jgi:hypothetical protein